MDATTTLMLRSIDRNFVEKLKERTQETSGSKAFISAATSFLNNVDRTALQLREQRIVELEGELYRLKHLLLHKKEVFQKLTALCIQVAEIAGQDELFR